MTKHGDLSALISVRYDKPTENDSTKHDYDIAVDITTGGYLDPETLADLLRGLAGQIEADFKKAEEVSE